MQHATANKPTSETAVEATIEITCDMVEKNCRNCVLSSGFLLGWVGGVDDEDDNGLGVNEERLNNVSAKKCMKPGKML